MYRLRSNLASKNILRWHERELVIVDDIHGINKQVIGDESWLQPNIFATYSNQDCVTINAGVFAKWCNDQTCLSSHC